MQPAFTSESENKALIRRWFEEVWNQGRIELIDELRAPDVIVTGLGDGGAQSRGSAHFRILYENLRGAFPDLVVRIEDIIAEGDKVVVRVTLEGTHLGDTLGFPPTGHRVSFGGISIARVANGKIAEAWNNLDQLGLLRQIEALPAGTVRENLLITRA